jgi:hypothetical protein
MGAMGQDVEVPQDLAEALRTAAAAVPEADLHHTGPVLRLQHRRRRRRQAATALGGIGAVAAMALTVLAVGPSTPGDEEVVVGDGTERRTTAPLPTAPTAPDVDGRHDDDGPRFLPRAATDWLPDGTARPVPRVQPDDGVIDALRLADGGTVTLATRNLRPGEARMDGAFVEDMAFVMAVFDADGALVGEQDVRRVGGYVDLVGESGGKVVLARRQSIGNCCEQQPLVDFSVIDPTSFVEEPLVSVDDAHGPADADDTRLVAASDPGIGVPGACRLHLVDLRDRPGGGDPPPNVELPDCIDVDVVALSPDDSKVAVVATTQGGATPDELRLGLYVVDVERAEVVHTDDLEPGPCVADPPVCGRTQVWALDWTDEATLAVVVQDPDPALDGAVIDTGLLVPERLRTITVPLP